jgi:hypothetical protein
MQTTPEAEASPSPVAAAVTFPTAAQVAVHILVTDVGHCDVTIYHTSTDVLQVLVGEFLAFLLLGCSLPIEQLLT